MLAKYWKKFLLIILIIACIINVMYKLVHKMSLRAELESSATYINQQNIDNNKNENKKLDK